MFPISFLYIDICGLKMVNDTLGHAQGDRMILTAAELVDKVIQMPKFSIRMGGGRVPYHPAELHGRACRRVREKSEKGAIAAR